MSLEPTRLDSCARLHLDRRGRVSSYVFFGLLGAVFGTAVIVTLGAHLGVSPRLLVVAVVAPLVSLAVGLKLAQIIAGQEWIVMYEQLLVALLGSALAFWLTGCPIWAGLDWVVLGGAVSLACGRVGCLFAGCCHGRPWRWGISYQDAHANAGFPRYFVGVKLFPLQLVEALAHACLAVLAVLTLLAPHRPGDVVVLYFSVYAVVRFTLEFARGDGRPYALGLSEAQWIAVTTAWISAGIAIHWPRPLAPWFVAIALLLSAAAVAVIGLMPRLRGTAWYQRSPHRTSMLAQALASLSPSPSTLQTTETADGLRISFSVDDNGRHYGLSSTADHLTAGSARALAEQIALLRHQAQDFQFTASPRTGIFLITFQTREPEPQNPRA